MLKRTLALLALLASGLALAAAAPPFEKGSKFRLGEVFEITIDNRDPVRVRYVQGERILQAGDTCLVRPYGRALVLETKTTEGEPRARVHYTAGDNRPGYCPTDAVFWISRFELERQHELFERLRSVDTQRPEDRRYDPLRER